MVAKCVHSGDTQVGVPAKPVQPGLTLGLELSPCRGVVCTSHGSHHQVQGMRHVTGSIFAEERWYRGSIRFYFLRSVDVDTVCSRGAPCLSFSSHSELGGTGEEGASAVDSCSSSEDLVYSFKVACGFYV